MSLAVDAREHGTPARTAGCVQAVHVAQRRLVARGVRVEHVRAAGDPLANVEFSPLDVTYRFVRRKDFAAAGLTYTPQFTADGINFVDSADAPVQVLDLGGDYEIVEVPFMVFLPNGMKASAALARVQVTLD